MARCSILRVLTQLKTELAVHWNIGGSLGSRFTVHKFRCRRNMTGPFLMPKSCLVSGCHQAGICCSVKTSLAEEDLQPLAQGLEAFLIRRENRCHRGQNLTVRTDPPSQTNSMPIHAESVAECGNHHQPGILCSFAHNLQQTTALFTDCPPERWPS